MAVVGVVVPSPVVEQSIHHCTGLMVVGSQWHNTDFLNTQTATDPTCFTTLWHSPCPRRAECPGPGSWRPWPGRRWTRGPASWWSRMGLTSVLRCIAVALGHWCDHYETVYNTDWDQESTGTDTGHASLSLASSVLLHCQHCHNPNHLTTTLRIIAILTFILLQLQLTLTRDFCKRNNWDSFPQSWPWQETRLVIIQLSSVRSFDSRPCQLDR